MAAAMFKDLCKRLVYACGLLGLYHRLRNAGSLTVVMFHRTLDPADPRWRSCDPDYTVSVDVLRHSLDFFRRHYRTVSLQQVLEARRGGARLPRRALLITFDDGWADNADYALPELRRAGLPALMFVVADAVGRRQPFFQERIIAAWRGGRLQVPALAEALARRGVEGLPREDTIDALRAALAALERLKPAVREALLAPYAAALDDGLRHMVEVEDLRRLQREGVALGLHGKTHVPMTRAEDLDAELAGAREILAERLGAAAAVAMSFPHGLYDDAIAARARGAGYELVFTSVPVLNPTRGGVGWLLGRTGFDTDVVVDRRGRFRPDLLALHLFRAPLRAIG